MLDGEGLAASVAFGWETMRLDAVAHAKAIAKLFGCQGGAVGPHWESGQPSTGVRRSMEAALDVRWTGGEVLMEGLKFPRVARIQCFPPCLPVVFEIGREVERCA